MRLLDTNVFLRFIAQPRTTQDVLFNRVARELFNHAERGEEQFTTTEAVIAEVLYVLTSSTIYGFSREDAAESMKKLVSLVGCRMENRLAIIAALDTWSSTRKLAFVDALCMEIARLQDYDLVTFDTALAKAAGTQRWDLRSSETDAADVEMP